jgi:hypothetical protein
MAALFGVGGSSNYQKYNNPTVESAIARLATAVDPKVIKGSENTIVENVLKDLPVVWTLRTRIFFVTSKAALKDFKMFYQLRPIVEDAWLEKAKS